MRLEDFDYPFDESLIAQHPIEPRDRARLLVMDRRTGALAHHRFGELPTLLRPNDLLVLNDTQVIPARLPGRKRPSGGKVEVLLVRQGEEANRWHALVRGHVGPGTFKPVTCEDIGRHVMDPEWYELPAATAKVVNETRAAGGRIVAVGSTAVRVLETAAQKGWPLEAGTGETSLFIYPGFRFSVVDLMLTNFHLPKSTLFMLVCALAGRERTLEAYRVAAAQRYRFYSYGDAMLIG